MEMGIRAYIIDDEAPARRGLRYLLAQAGRVEVVGESPNGASGLKGIRETRPQVVFLDVQMPGLDGLQLSQVLQELPDKPLVIFATAFERYAVDAFNVEAFDYILKPFTLERVQKSLHKAEKFLCKEAGRSVRDEEGEEAVEGRPKAQLHEVKKLMLYKGDRIIPISPDKIVWAKSVDGEILVQTRDDTYSTKSTLTELEAKLSPCGFIRTHRGSLVNINHVLEVIPWFHGNYKLIMNDKEKTEIVVSRNSTKELKRLLDL